MKKLLALLVYSIFIGSLSFSFGQDKKQNEVDSFLETDEGGFGDVNDMYSLYYSEQILGKNLLLRLERIQTNVLGGSHIELPLLMKYGFNDRFRFYFGPKLNFFKTAKSTEFNFSNTIGIEYKINNLTLEARFNYLLLDEFKAPEFKTHYQYGSRSSFILGSRFKF